MKKKNTLLLLSGLAGGIGGGLLLWQKFKAYQPQKALPLRNFQPEKYLGKWYEIARFDYRFERNLEQVTAEYSLQPDGSIGVLNRGYDVKAKEWKSAKGKAVFRHGQHTAALKVSFFGPFYSGYNVIALSGDYKYALVAGESLDYLWLLSRHPEMPEEIRADFLAKAKAVGYDVGQLKWVRH